MFLALFIELVERVFQVSEKLVAGVKSLGGGKSHVVGVQRVGYDQVQTVALMVPVGKIVSI